MVKQSDLGGVVSLREGAMAPGPMATVNSSNVMSFPNEPTMEGVAKEEDAMASSLPLFQESNEPMMEGDLDFAVKDEPIDGMLEEPQIPNGAANTGAMNHPDFGIAALLSFSRQAQFGGGIGTSFTQASKAPKMEADEDGSNVPSTSQRMIPVLLPVRRYMPTHSPSVSGDIYQPIPKRGRPPGQYSDEEVGEPHDEEIASDPQKRRQANNREAAKRCRMKKKNEMWELKLVERCAQEKNRQLKERLMFLKKEVIRWKIRCFKTFNFAPPQFDFEDYSYPPLVRESSGSAEPMDFSVGESSSSSSDPTAHLHTSHFRERTEEELEELKKEEEELSARNLDLSTQAVTAYFEIIQLRQKMGYENVFTSADRNLPPFPDLLEA